MKAQYLFLIAVALSNLWISGFAQAQQQEQERPIVRIIYFYPKDRSPQPDIDAKLDKLVKDVQQVYAGLMVAHGFGRKTFLFETDTIGEVVVHHVKGKFNDAYYQNQAGMVWQESGERFDLSENIYLAFLDVSTELLDGLACGYGGFHGSFAGSALIPASGGCFDGALGVDVTAHELGHSFGLAHDFRTDTDAERIFLNTDDLMITSYCAAEWLNAHAAFNTDAAAFSHNTTAKILPPNFISAPNTFSLRFEVTDPDGLHQVQLLIPKSDGDLLLRDCKELNGAADSTVEFITVLSHRTATVSLRYIDTNGNYSTQTYPIDVASMLPTTDPPSPESGLTAYWTFNEKDGNITSDLSRNGHDGTLIGDPQWVEGYFDGALEFDQDKDEVNVPYHKSLNPESFTVCAWANLEPGSSGYRAVVSSRDDFPQRGYILYANPNNNWEFWIGTGTRWSSTGGPAANPGKWDHLAGVYADGIQEFYVNGQFMGSVQAELSVNQSQELLIGAGANEVYSHAYHFKGKIDHVYIYDRALTEAEIALVMNGDPIAMEQSGQIAEDVNGDGVVNIQDLVFVASSFGETGQNAADVNGDEVVDIRDLVKVASAFGNTAAAPSIIRHQAAGQLTSTDVQQWLTQAQHAKLTDATSQRGLLFLQHLLAVLTPKETILLANYPNPFNPETWIPYQLAKPVEVSISIYAVDGKLVRALDLGHQLVGIYQDKSRAVYWDGRNAVGEPVASGVYFYTLTAGDFAATRKMLIRK